MDSMLGSSMATMTMSDGAGRRERRIAVIEVAIRVREVHGLIQRMDITCAVISHGPQVEVLEDVECLQHDRPLLPRCQLVDLDPLVVGVYGLFDLHLPVGQIGFREQPALFAGPTYQLLGNVTFIEAVIRSIDRRLAILAVRPGTFLRFNELA